MDIDWQNFTWLSALAGGLIIGSAASVLLLFNGKIAGISGILGGALRIKSGDQRWQLAFLAGLFLSPILYRLANQTAVIQIDTIHRVRY